MRSLADTVARLAALGGAGRRTEPLFGSDRLADLADSGANPGSLRARIYIPSGLSDDAPLVVVLHGCTQTAAEYDRGSGWSHLADRYGFALLFPEQRRTNNSNLCFNWFEPKDTRRGAGEALSIREMIEKVVSDHGLDRRRIFITGLSAGGAMASVMLVTYPEVFAGGAIIAGLPYGCATSMPTAFDRMRGHGGPTQQELATLARGASKHQGPWPTISVWHGTADHVVDSSNAEAIIAQWRSIHPVGAAPTFTETVDGYPRRVWCDADGNEMIEQFSITGMGHGVPLAPGGDGGEYVSAFMLDVGISSTRHTTDFWGLTSSARADGQGAGIPGTPINGSRVIVMASPLSGRTGPVLPDLHQTAGRTKPAGGLAMGVGQVIEDALRKAGLMR